MPHPLIELMADMVRKAPKPKAWTNADLTEQTLSVLQRECETPSDFDQIFSREHFWALYRTGRIDPVVKRTDGAILVALLNNPDQMDEIPWDLWSILLQLYKRPDGQPYTIFFCAHPALRQFPKKNKPVTPLNINGGYAYPCDSTCVFIYRAEDATRVLIHELFHAACSDNTALPLEVREAETEAWAELIWAAFMCDQAKIRRGDLKDLEKIVHDQASYIHHQNRILKDQGHMKGNPSSMPFPWRYTVGKEDMWTRWGISVYETSNASHAKTSNDRCEDHKHSLRLTFHPTKDMKQRWKVSDKSTIL